MVVDVVPTNTKERWWKEGNLLIWEFENPASYMKFLTGTVRGVFLGGKLLVVTTSYDLSITHQIVQSFQPDVIIEVSK